MKKEIYITMDGGLIQSIHVTEDLGDLEAIVIVDLDTDGCIDPGVIELPDGEDAYVYESDFHVIDDGDVEYYKEIRNNIYNGDD